MENRLRLTTIIKGIRYLANQALAFRGHDESVDPSDRGNFIEIIKSFARMNIEVEKVILDRAPQKAQYIAHDIQKQILPIFSNKVRKTICKELRKNKFCILVDESLDESNKEQMAIILRFVDYCMLRELNDKFLEQTIELLILNSVLDPCNSFKSFNIEHICKLVGKFYPADFLPNELKDLEIKLRSVQLLVTLPVSTATTERAFSCMRMIKNRLRSTIADEFLVDCMTLQIERKFANSITNASIIEEFKTSKSRRVKF
ncbi:unnamed protein product [Prunus brigantina]